MSIGISIPFTSVETENITTKTYAINWDTNRIVGYVNEQSALRQFIKKSLITPRYKCLIYDSDYGSEIEANILQSYITREYLETELPFLVKDAIIHDERILDVYDFKFDYDSVSSKDEIIISFSVDTIFGTMEVEEVI